MPEQKTMRRARRAKRSGKAPSTQASEFVREEIHHVREGKHGARSAKQVIAIGLSKARRAGVKLPAPAKEEAKEQTRRQAMRDLQAGAERRKPNPRRSRATKNALKSEARTAASNRALSRQAKSQTRRGSGKPIVQGSQSGRRKSSGPQH